MESSDQEEKEAAKKSKKDKKALTEAELEETVDVELTETSTITLLHIPGVVVNHDTPPYFEAQKNNKAYEALRQSKIGSDSYMIRGSQTGVFTSKTKSENFEGFTQEHKEVTASMYDIHDASKLLKVTESKQ